MPYKAGGTEQIHGGRFSTMVVVNEDELAYALEQGWALSTPDALYMAAEAEALKKEAEQVKTETADSAQPTRAELEQKAAEMGLQIDKRWGDKRLQAEIEAALKS